MMIKYLKHNEIDKKRWDEIIEKSTDDLIYVRSFYLDIVAPEWEALIMNDYEYIMPLPVRKKFGFYYIFQPFLVQQLGIFSPYDIKQEIISTFLKSIPEKYKYIHLNFNEKNIDFPPDFMISWRTNLILYLNKPYNEIYQNYNRLRKRCLKKSSNVNIEIHEINNIGLFLNFINI